MKTKEQILKKYKLIATSLFILMLIGFIICSLALKKFDYTYIKAIRAFCEAAMVGALADWFAVTAIFKKPVGINIPHTNLIEKNKDDIGANLGIFIHDNFLTPEALTPYIQKIDIVGYISNYALANEKHILTQFKNLSFKLINELDEEKLVKFALPIIQNKIEQVDASQFLNPTIDSLLSTNYQKKVIDSLLLILLENIPNLKPIIKDQVNKKALGFGSFVSNYISEQIIFETQGFINKMVIDSNNESRILLKNKFSEAIESIKTNESILLELNELKNNLFINNGSNIIKTLINKGKIELLIQIDDDNSQLNNLVSKIFSKSIEKLNDFNTKKNLNIKFQEFITSNLTTNSHYVTKLIKETVEKWDSKELSNKMELEVGKDLQFIRINGTLIGGLVGLLIFYLSYFIL